MALTIRRYLKLPLLTGILAFACDGTTQAPAPPPDLDTILARLEANLVDYERHVPNLYADEHVFSEIVRLNSMEGRQVTVTDSTFRLRRENASDGLAELIETRDIKTIDGKAPTSASARLGGPSVLSGVFSSGLNIVSLRGKPCFNYKLQPGKGKDRGNLLIAFENKPQGEYGKNCPTFEVTSGRAIVDPATMQVMRMEKRTPDHPLFKGTVGLWRWTAEYGPVQLNGQTFFLPRTIASVADYNPPTAGGDAGSTRARAQVAASGFNAVPLHWTFTATYRDFHLLTATSRILGAPDDAAAPAPKP